MIASTTTEPTKMKTRNNFIADAFGTDRSARNVNNGTSGPAGPIPKAPWRSSGIGNMPPITIDAAQSASTIPAGAAHRHLPDKSCSAPVSRSLLQRRRQLHCRSKNCVKCRNVFFSSFCSSDSAKNQVWRGFALPELQRIHPPNASYNKSGISECNPSPGARPKPTADFLRRCFAKPVAYFSRSIAAGHEPAATERTSAAPSA